MSVSLIVLLLAELPVCALVVPALHESFTVLGIGGGTERELFEESSVSTRTGSLEFFRINVNWVMLN